jgi:hypothetical protein
MWMMPGDPLPIACTLTPSEGLTRMQRWQRLHAQALVSTALRDDGVEVTYRHSPDVTAELAELVEAERECCAFATWDVASDDDTVVLTIASRSAADRAAVAELLALFGSDSQRDHSAR